MDFDHELTLQGFVGSRSVLHGPSSNILQLHWKYSRRVFWRTHNGVLPPTEDEPLAPSRFSQFGFCFRVPLEFRRQIWISLEGLNFPPPICDFLFHEITSFSIDFATDLPIRMWPSIIIVADINFIEKLYVDYIRRPLELIQPRQQWTSAFIDETVILGGRAEGRDGTEAESNTFLDETFIVGISAEVNSRYLDESFNLGTSTEGLGEEEGEENSRIEMMKRRRRRGKWVMGGGEETTCSVCLEGFCEGEEVMRMECEHIYHEECIIKWLKEKQTCPLCRGQI